MALVTPPHHETMGRYLISIYYVVEAEISWNAINSFVLLVIDREIMFGRERMNGRGSE